VFAAQQDLDVVGYAAEFSDVQLPIFTFTTDNLWAAKGLVADVKLRVFGSLVGDPHV